MNLNGYVIAVLIGVAGAIVLAALWAAVSRKRGAALLDEARRNADRILEDARKSAESRSTEADLEVKEKLLQMRSDFDRKSQQRNDELKTSERRLQQKEENLDKKTQQLDTRMAEVETRDRRIGEREKTLEQREGELGELIEAQRHKLEQVAGLTTEEAKRELIRGIENEAKLDAAQIIKRIETEANESGHLKARKILGMAIQRMASD
ncbi:MAG: Rnase Y domain-containing protein, partial [bacterium]